MPQLFENDFNPLCGLALVPSGKMIIDDPFFSFFEPSLMTFFKLVIFFDLVKWIGFRQARAHPKKGINNNSFFIILEEGKHKVCKKNDSHAPWWFDTRIQGLLGILLIPEMFQFTPHITFKAFRIKNTHIDAIFCKDLVFRMGNSKITTRDAGITVRYNRILNKKLNIVCNLKLYLSSYNFIKTIRIYSWLLHRVSIS